MATLTFSAALDTNIPIVEEHPDGLKASAYFEDYLFKLFQDIEAINVIAGGNSYGIVNGNAGSAAAGAPSAALSIIGGTAISTVAADGAPDSVTINNDAPFPEAPIDGNIYGRLNAGWSNIDAFGLDHGGLAGLGDDDHLQYLLLAGRAGGQSAIGGLASGEVLSLRGSTDADLGFVDIFSPIRIDVDWTVSGASDVITWDTVVPSSGLAVSGFLRVTPEIHIDSGLFIFGTVIDQGRYLQEIAPGFAVHTLFLGQPNLETSTATVQPNQVFIYAAQPQMENNGAGGLGTPIPNIIGMTVTPQLITRVIGDTLSVTNLTGVQLTPNFSTVAFTTINFGTIRGLHCTNPAQGLFQPGAGVEAMTAYIGLEMNAIPFGGNVTKAAVRSALVDATNTRFLDNIGTAQSDFGAGDIHLDDNTAVKFGASVAAPDMLLFWNNATTAMRFAPFFGTGGNPIEFLGTAGDEWIFRQAAALDIGIQFDMNAISFGTVLPTPNSNNWFVIFSGPNLRQVQIGGEYSDVLWTAGGTIDVNGQAVSDLQAFKINAVATILNGGSVADSSTLYVAAMASSNATRVQALRVLGRSRMDGVMNNGSLSVAGFGAANQDDLQLGQNNNQRAVNLITSTAAVNITGIDSSFGFAQDGDRICLYNIGAFAITITNQDAASLAANRIITSTGVGYVLGPNEMVWLWYDDTGTVRWRMFAGTGA